MDVGGSKARPAAGLTGRATGTKPRAMLVGFFSELKAAGVPVTLREYLTLMQGLEADLAGRRVEDFYYLARAALVKDERHLDKFDRVFAQCFKGLEPPEGVNVEALPEEWLRKLAEKLMTPEEMEKIQSLGGFDAIM